MCEKLWHKLPIEILMAMPHDEFMAWARQGLELSRKTAVLAANDAESCESVDKQEQP